MPWQYDMAANRYYGPPKGPFRRNVYTRAQKLRRQAIARGRIRALTVFRNIRYRRRVAAAKQQVMYRVRQLPAGLQSYIANFVRPPRRN